MVNSYLVFIEPDVAIFGLSVHISCSAFFLWYNVELSSRIHPSSSAVSARFRLIQRNLIFRVGQHTSKVIEFAILGQTMKVDLLVTFYLKFDIFFQKLAPTICGYLNLPLLHSEPVCSFHVEDAAYRSNYQFSPCQGQLAREKGAENYVERIAFG